VNQIFTSIHSFSYQTGINSSDFIVTVSIEVSKDVPKEVNVYNSLAYTSIGLYMALHLHAFALPSFGEWREAPRSGPLAPPVSDRQNHSS
jgi:hypothetical protein